MTDLEVAPARPGRPRSTTHAELERQGITLFLERGYDETSIDDIAAAAGIGRRTFFRYFHNKADLVWGDFEAELQRMRDCLARYHDDRPMMETVRRAVVDFNAVARDDEEEFRRRLTLILGVPSLIAHSTLRFAQWREVVAEFAAARLGLAPDDLVPTVVGHCAFGATIGAYETWMRTDGLDLGEVLDDAFGQLAQGFPVGGQ